MKDILVALPLELALEVVSWLPSKDLLALGRTSKAWQQVIAADNNDEVLWRGRATAEFDAKTPCKNLGGDHMTWNSICRCQKATDYRRKECVTESRWIVPEGEKVWRIKVDQEQRMMFVSTRNDEGELRVFDLDTCEQLQCIEGVGAYAHLELGDGYLVASQQRRLRIWKTPRVVAKAVELYQASAWDREGQSSDAQSSTPCIVERRLVEHGDIVPVDNYFALRCVGTTLMTASPGIASLWDLPTKKLIRAYPINLHSLQYVEFDDEFLFILGGLSLNIYDRRTGTRILHFAEYDEEPSEGSYISGPAMMRIDKAFAPIRRGTSDLRSEALWFYNKDTKATTLFPFMFDRPEWSADAREFAEEFQAVHYTDRDLYLITDNGIVFIFLDYKASLRADEGDTDAINRLVSHNIRVLDMRDDSRAMTNNLACHGDDAAFTLQTRSIPHQLCRIGIDRDPLTGRAKDTRMHLLPGRHLQSVTSLQMTEEGVYLSYNIAQGALEDLAFAQKISQRVGADGIPFAAERDPREPPIRTAVRCIRYRPH